mgnify:CR=1 FL=1
MPKQKFDPPSRWPLPKADYLVQRQNAARVRPHRSRSESRGALRAGAGRCRAGSGDHTLVGEWAKSLAALLQAGAAAGHHQMYRMPTICTSCSILAAWSCRKYGRYISGPLWRKSRSNRNPVQHKVLITVRQIMQTAQANHLIRDDPTDRHRITTHARPKQKKYLTQDEAEELLSSIAEPRAKVFCALCYYCGLRKEEALGLQWRDVGPAALVVSRR